MDRQDVAKEFAKLTDTPANIRKWIAAGDDIRDKASLDNQNEFGLPSGRHNAERVLKLKEAGVKSWSESDHEFAAQVVNYAKRSAGIATHHPHAEKSEIGDTGMTKNEIARRNWGLPESPKKPA